MDVGYYLSNFLLNLFQNLGDIHLPVQRVYVDQIAL